MSQISTIAVLMTCFNRRETTLRCLNSLYAQDLPAGVSFDVILVDDGCTDGTGDTVRREYPLVNIIHGDGNLYWCGGTRLAFSEAMRGDYAFYLWLNDDTLLQPDAIATLLSTASNVRHRTGRDGIIVGSCRDSVTGKHSYGGRIRKNLRLVTPSDDPQLCDMINGNIVLIPREISIVVRNISPEYIHYGGDNDYGLRAIKAGFTAWVAPGYQGTCASHVYTSWNDPAIPFSERWRSLHSPKGQPPYEVYVFARRHSGFFWPMDLIKLYLRVIFPGWYNKLKGLVKTKLHTSSLLKDKIQ